MFYCYFATAATLAVLCRQNTPMSAILPPAPSEPFLDIAHPGHLELLTPKPEATLDFFVHVLGMAESGRGGNSVFLRGWDDDEPGGNRFEMADAGGRLVLALDWNPIVWTETERKKGQTCGQKTIESFHTHGTPPLPDAHEDDNLEPQGQAQ